MNHYTVLLAPMVLNIMASVETVAAIPRLQSRCRPSIHLCRTLHRGVVVTMLLLSYRL